MSTSTLRAGSVAVSFALVLALDGAPVAASTPHAPVATGEVTVVDVVVSPTSDDLADGFATLTVDVALRSAAGLPDVLNAGALGTDGVVVAGRAGGTVPWLTLGEGAPAAIVWSQLERVSGTATEGVWRGTTLTSPIHTGAWVVTPLDDVGTPEVGDTIDVSAFGSGVTLAAASPAWKVVPAPTAPIEIIKGTETWTPRARVTDRATGAGVAAPWIDYYFFGEPDVSPAVQYPAGSLTVRADAQGYVTLGRRPVNLSAADPDRHVIHVYRSRGVAGFSWEAETVLWPWVKWRASQELSTAGRTVTAIGKAWPAPSIYRAANPNVYLQQLHGRTWRTVGTGRVRANGRYTLTWAAPSAGRWAVRVYKPGGSERNGQIRSTGTVLPTVWVTTR